MDLLTFLSTSFQDVRSSKRTDKLHRALLNEFLNTNVDWAEYNWKYEYLLPEDAYNGTFKIDIAGFIDGQVKIAILAKALNSNIGKNVKNYANTSIGEAARLMFAPNVFLDKVLFVSVMPRVSPIFNNKGEVTGYDDVERLKKRTNIDPVLHSQYKGKVETVDLYFDIENVYSVTDFSEIGVRNLDKVVYSQTESLK